LIRFAQKMVTSGVVLLAGCAMWSAMLEIPTPEGCGSCHHQTISANWQVAYQPVALTDETGRMPWQQPSSVLPPESAPYQQQNVTEQACFHCHREPDRRHRDFSGTYHHQSR